MEQRPGLDPQELMRISMGMMAPRLLAAAVQLDLFSRIAEGRETAGDLALAASASERGVRMLADALCALGLLGKADGRYRLTPASKAYLVKSSPDYVGAIMESDHLWTAWGRLPEVVRTGRVAEAVEKQDVAEAFFPVLIRSLHVLNREPARRLAAALGAGARHSGLRVLDVAAGSGVWGIAIAEADAAARVTAQDFPGVLASTREFAERHGVAGRFEYMPGDLKDAAFGSGRFDVAILGNIVHSEGEASSRRLFGRLHEALAPGGRIAIVDMLPAEDRTGPPPAVLFALNMLVNTEHGDTFTLSQYRAWLNEAGFAGVETADIGLQAGMGVCAVIAVK
ncbi:MAG TPA: methyltransferase [Acidiphilium sp.]